MLCSGSVGNRLALDINEQRVYLDIRKVNFVKHETIAGMTAWDCKFRMGGVSKSWDSFKDIPAVPQSHDFIDQNNPPREEAVGGRLEV